MAKIKVLFLCTGNTARSQMAEAYLRYLDNEHFEAFSAGLEPSEINPLTLQVMEEVGIDMSGQYSKSLSQFFGKVHFGYLITVCDRAEARCPIFPGMGIRLHWPIEDPAAFQGAPKDKLEKFREVREQIRTAVQDWINSLNETVN
jgi:arsenate reductase